MMEEKYLARDDAPIESDTWKAMDAALVETARGILVGRRILPIEGPYGFGLKSVPLEDVQLQEDVYASSSTPLAAIEVGFTLGKRDLLSFERDELPLNLNALVDAAIRASTLEDDILLKGDPRLCGLLNCERINSQALAPWDELGTAAGDVIKAVIDLDNAGYHGPYAVALSPSRYDTLYRRHPIGAFSELEQIQTIATEGVFKAPVLEKGGLVLNTGRAYASIVLGQDMTISFVGPTKENLEFAIVESLALLVRRPGAVCALTE
ncbi:MAG: family 1 encapsulin nanocompartment shell protein [Dehalococcoidia bacterium]|jgi:uncharacterized linocin/CFP29 family protein